VSGPRFASAELLQATGGRFLGEPPAEVAGVSTDTREIARGDLFVALRGERFDAHDFLAEAAARGAACAVVEAARAPSLAAGALPLLAVESTLEALGALARHHRRRFPVPVVGVTGSNGKTTTREMVAAILGVRGPVLRTEGNLNNEVGVPQTLFRLGPGHTAAVVEMGMNHPGEISRLAAIAEPRVGLVTNASVAHLHGLGSVEAVASAKAELYRGLPPDGIVVANLDDPRMLAKARKSGRQVVTFAVGRDKEADVAVLEIEPRGEDGQLLLLGVGTKELPVSLALVGAHNAANAAAAAAAAVALGASDREIALGLAAVRPVGRRLRLSRLPSGALLVDDCYNANPASMAAALDTLAELARGGRALAALGDMLELGEAEAESHRELGRLAQSKGVAVLATFGPRTAATHEAALAAGLPAASAFHTEDAGALAAFFSGRLGPGDVLLVKASRGMKLERLVETLR